MCRSLAQLSGRTSSQNLHFMCKDLFSCTNRKCFFRVLALEKVLPHWLHWTSFGAANPSALRWINLCLGEKDVISGWMKWIKIILFSYDFRDQTSMKAFYIQVGCICMAYHWDVFWGGSPYWLCLPGSSHTAYKFVVPYSFCSSHCAFHRNSPY